MSNVPTNLIPTTVTGLPEYTGSSTLGYLPYVVDGRTYKVQFSNIAAVGAVPSSRTVATGTGLTGGGDLSANRTIAIANGGVGTAQLAASGVSAGVYGSGTLVPVLTVDATGRVTSATTAAVSVSGFVPTSRSVIAGTGLTGGGALTSDVTLNVNFSSSTPQALGTATAGVSTAAARGDHVHPAVDLADTSQTQGALPLGRGGTGDALSPVAGAVVYSTGTRFALSPLGLPGQVLMSDGANAPQWATVSGVGTVTSVNVSGGTTGLTFSGGPVTAAGTITMAGTLAVGNGGTGVTSSTGTGSVVLSTSPTLVTPTLGVASATSIATGLGAVGAPSHTFTGDTATGMWSPATNFIAFSTAGTERMRIRSNGRVGINVDPGAQFQVRGPASDTMAEIANFQSINVAGTDTHGLAVAADAVGNIVQLASTGNNAGGFTFLTGSSERMRVDSSGNVLVGKTAAGVGTDGAQFIPGGFSGFSAPGTTALFLNRNTSDGTILEFGRNGVSAATMGLTSSALTVSTAGTERMRIESTGAVVLPKMTLSTDTPFLTGANINSGANSLAMGGSGTGVVSLFTNNTERMRVTSAGLVGIGTSAPQYTLHLGGGTVGAVNGSLGLGDIASKPSGLIQGFREAGDFSGSLLFSTTTAPGVVTERMRITSTGLVGIGVTPSPSSEPLIQMPNGGMIATAGQYAHYMANAYYAAGGWRYTTTGIATRYEQGIGTHSWHSAPSGTAGDAITFTERMRINSAGQVGIGTTNPAARLHVVGVAIADQFRLQDVLTDATIKYGVIGSGHYTNAEEPFLMAMGVSSATSNNLALGGGATSLNAATVITFFTAANITTTTGTERMRIVSSGEVGIGTSSPGARLHVVNANHANMFRLQDVVTDATNKIAAMGMGHYTNAEEPIALISGISTLTGTSLTIGGNVSSMNAAMDIAFNTATTPTTLNGTTRLNVKANGQVRFVPLAAAPGSPEAGDVYYDSTTNKLRCYNGTTWNDLF